MDPLTLAIAGLLAQDAPAAPPVPPAPQNTLAQQAQAITGRELRSAGVNRPVATPYAGGYPPWGEQARAERESGLGATDLAALARAKGKGGVEQTGKKIEVKQVGDKAKSPKILWNATRTKWRYPASPQWQSGPPPKE